MNLWFKLQIFFFQEVQFVGAGTASIQLFLQHCFSLQQDLIIFFQFLQITVVANMTCYMTPKQKCIQ